MTSPPRKRSVQWSPPPTIDPEERERERGRAGPSPRSYNDCPTPHPKKLSDASSYFDSVPGSARHPDDSSSSSSAHSSSKPASAPPRRQSLSTAPPEPPKPALVHDVPKRSGLLRRSSTMDSEIRERHATERAQLQAGRAALLRRSSSLDSSHSTGIAAGRTFSTLEDGPDADGRPAARRRRSSAGGVVGAFMRFGAGRKPTASLFGKDEKEGGAASGAASTLSSGASYKERAKMLRERRSVQIVNHVEGRWSFSGIMIRDKY